MLVLAYFSKRKKHTVTGVLFSYILKYMKLYDANGYADQTAMIDGGNTFIFEVGARGTGKTYGAMLYILSSGKKFLYLRRTKTEADLVKSDITNPFKVINMDIGTDVKAGRGQYVFPFIQNGDIIGYGAALSTFYNVRGVDFSDVEIIIYDEFIPENAARPIKNEFDALMNVIETVNRNRELKGRKPVKLVCMANSNKLDNPIFLGLELVNKVAKMAEKGNEIYMDPSRELTVYMLMHSPISEKKAQTALYKLTAGNDFQRMALQNQFDMYTDNIRPSKLKEYRPVVKIGELYIYKHKSRKEYYATCTCTGTFTKRYTTADIDVERFVNHYIYLFDAHIHSKVWFEDPVSVFLFEHFFDA